MKLALIFLTICATIVAGEYAEEEARLFAPVTLVDVPGLGKVRGTTRRTYLTKRQYPAFTGIPYARVAKRFAPPVEVTRLTQSDNEVFDATRAQAPCPQIGPLPIVPGSNDTVEDCLTLNIYTPSVKTNKPLPVIFFIHGGSFIRWSGNMWSAARLLEREVILVTINYRLGPLGFFCLGTDEAPGNAGMYDLVESLRWVQKHIRSFGGDPSRVTIAGQSAGGASVSWLLDSPLAKGLFHGALALSGADVDGWAIQNFPIKTSLTGAQTLNCSFFLNDANGQPTTVPDNDKILNCMRALPASAFSLPLIRNTFYTAPCVQNFNLTIPKFAPNHPAVSMALGLQEPVPLIIGTTKHDGTFLTGRLYSQLAASNLQNNADFLKNQLLPSLFQSWGLTDDPPGTLNSLLVAYFGTSNLSGNFSEMAPGIIDLYSALYFKMGAYAVANYHATINPNTFLYSFDYFGSETYYPFMGGVPQVPRGVAHSDDLFYVFEQGAFTRAEDYLISFFMVDAWVNFATTGDPNKRSINDEPLFNAWPKWNLASHEFVKINVIPTEDNNYQAYWVGASKDIKG